MKIKRGHQRKKLTTENFLKDKPLFKNIVDKLFDFLETADELIMHNAGFDINFINNELKIINYKIKNIKNELMWNLVSLLKVIYLIYFLSFSSILWIFLMSC